MDVGNEIGWVDTYLPQHIILIRLAIAAVLGALIGFEREVHGHGAGFRTHILVAVAAALYTIVTFEIFHTIEDGQSRADPIRAVEAVTAGIAFLGAGAIFRGGASIQGLTTSAGMWLAGAVGVMTSLGHYIVAVAVAVFAVLVMAVLRQLSHKTLHEGDHPRDEKVPEGSEKA